MSDTINDGYGDLLDALAQEAEETDRLKAELSQHRANEPEPEPPVDLDSITDRDEFYSKLTNVSPAHGLPVDAGGSLDKDRPLFDHGHKPLNEAAKQVLRDRDPAFAAAEAEADARDYSNGVKVIA